MKNQAALKPPNPIFYLGAKVEISLFLVKTYNVFQHETSDEWMSKNVEKKKSESPQSKLADSFSGSAH